MHKKGEPVYTPTPEEFEARKAEVRRMWSETERRRRIVGPTYELGDLEPISTAGLGRYKQGSDGGV